ncbi:MAG: T9SS type A sorting domain-containing protein [Bacteroidales bacterium]|nr:T9SS type A sorting domain-containing protein [Bacteroidales bacterium]
MFTNAQKPIRYNSIDTIGVTHDICGERHGYIGDSYYDMPKILLDYENLYDANSLLYVSALDNYNTTYEGISIDWDNITAIDVTSNPQLFDLIQLSELKNILDETCIEAIHLLGNSTEVEITEITTWLQRLSSLNADLLGIHYLAQGNDVSQLQLAWDQITQQYSIVNPEDTSYYQYCINLINTWARDTATDVNISQGAIDTLTAIANSNNTASPYAVSVLECINEHYPWWRLRIHTSCNWTLPIESMSPQKETEQGQTDAIQLHPNPTNGIIEIQSNNLNIKQIELFDIFGKLLMEKKANESTVTLDVSPYAKGMYLLRYTLSDDMQQTKKIIKE